jgi:hypothetical protein
MKKILLATAIIIIAFTACKKSSAETPVPAAPTHLGLWKGKYSLTTNTQPTENVLYLFRQDGTMRVYNGLDTLTATQKGDGIWIKSPNTARVYFCQYAYVGTPTSFFSMGFEGNETFTESTSGTWYIGEVITNPTNAALKGIVKLTR